MKAADLVSLDTALGGPFHQIEPHLRELDKHLTVRTYLDGYNLSDVDRKIWLTLRSNRAGVAFIKKGSLVNLQRWFTCER